VLISEVRKIFMPLLLSVILLLAWTSISRSADYQQVPGLVDLRTTFSDGAYDVETLVEMSKQRGFSVVILNDHDLMVMEYGLPPLRNLISKKEEKNSILKSGAGKYIQAIKNVRKKYPDMIIIPGSESTAFYYWTGSPFRGNLTAHDHEKRILTIGMENPSDYEGLPMLHNSHSIQFLHHDLPGMILLFAAVLSAGAMIFFPGILKITGIIVLTLATVFIINSDPFRNSPFDAYHGGQGMAPYQLLIDYVNAKGGMTFWNYPETKSGVRKMGPIQISTLPYPEVLLNSRGYTGFSSLYGDDVKLTEPGNLWDLALMEYCRGFRERPPWGIATSDFHREGESGEKLGNYQTVFYVKEKKITEVLEALRNGRMYAAQGNFPQIVRMDEFSLSSADGKVKGISGDEVAISEKPHIKIVLSSEKQVTGQVKVRLIRGGEIIKIVEGPLPMQIEHEDVDLKPGEKTYYRMDMRGAGMIVSNPIFMTRPR
jgi:hypothetical protein